MLFRSGLKFDLRIYVLVYGCDPLRIYIFKEGLARLATKDYVPPTHTNLADMFVHLTNYAINKNNENYIFNEDASNANTGHKRSLEFVWKYVDEHGGNSGELKQTIREAIVKTFCAVQPQLADSYRNCQPCDNDNDKCFEILGFDILLDHKLKPWLLEVNHSPSFSTDTPFDLKVKSDLLIETMILLNMDPIKRINYYKQKELDAQNNYLGKNRTVKRLKKEERIIYKKEHMKMRDEYELEHCKNYTRIYPDLNDLNKYNVFLETAQKLWDKLYGPRNKHKSIPESPSRQSIRIPIDNKRIIKPRDGNYSKRTNTDRQLNKITGYNTDRSINEAANNINFVGIKETLNLHEDSKAINELEVPTNNSNYLHLPEIVNVESSLKKISSKGIFI